MGEAKRHGLVMINTGPGKGKTTAALGLALRAAGQGLKVHFIQFIKSGQGYGEAQALPLLPGVKLTALGLGLTRGGDLAPHRTKAQETLEVAKEALTSGQWGMVVLDELCVALAKGLVDLDQALDLLKLRHPQTHLVITGRDCPAQLMDLADTITVMQAERHHLTSGVTAQAGVEF